MWPMCGNGSLHSGVFFPRHPTCGQLFIFRPVGVQSAPSECTGPHKTNSWERAKQNFKKKWYDNLNVVLLYDFLLSVHKNWTITEILCSGWSIYQAWLCSVFGGLRLGRAKLWFVSFPAKTWWQLAHGSIQGHRNDLLLLQLPIWHI